MKQKRTRFWSMRDSDRMVRLRDVEKLSWILIAEALGRTTKQCTMRYYYLHQHMTSAARAERAADRWRPPPRPQTTCQPQQASPGTPTGRVLTTARLLLDAELRERIGAQGVTAGLCGDPKPGRSALDKRITVVKRAGV